MFDSIKAVKEKVINYLGRETTYTKKDAVVDIAVGAGSVLVFVELARQGSFVSVGAFAAVAMAGNFAKGMVLGETRGRKKLKGKVTKEAPKVATIRNLIAQENLDETFVVRFYTKNGKPIMQSAKPIYTYMNAVIEGSEGLENIELAASFNIEKYYTRKGDK
ncbi:PH domain-containing protein [Bacillus pretiosus]|uniref:Uncharacterized protein n=1 Tax=Bacillus pretiosus TaxID=2983392 RepID=A0ABT3EYX1_9BACI|nr:hypothetical protein [Bacillus pretiosus]MCW1241967.1 hypothetical protein [Bacillus pretiosus]